MTTAKEIREEIERLKLELSAQTKKEYEARDAQYAEIGKNAVGKFFVHRTGNDNRYVSYVHCESIGDNGTIILYMDDYRDPAIYRQSEDYLRLGEILEPYVECSRDEFMIAMQKCIDYLIGGMNAKSI